MTAPPKPSWESGLDILPDSRLKHPVGSVRRMDGWWVPVYCANCGTAGGLMPEDNITFAFYLCPKCFEVHGAPAHTAVTPDEAFWAQVAREQLDRMARMMTPAELLQALADPTHPIAKLAKDRMASHH